MYLGLRVVLANSFARIHRDNLVNFGIVPLVFESPKDGDRLKQGHELLLPKLKKELFGAAAEGSVTVKDLTGKFEFRARLDLSPRQKELLAAGGKLNYIKNKLKRGTGKKRAPRKELVPLPPAKPAHKTTGTPLYEAIGMSEISTYISSSPTVPRKSGKIGKPQQGRRIAVLPVKGGTEPLPTNTKGLLAIKRTDPGLMLGYWNRPNEQSDVFRGEWFIGGDLAMIDEEGYVTHLGRENDIMKALGYRVSPQEVEHALIKHETIAEIACTEFHVRKDVSIIAAFIVLKEGAKPNTKALETFAKEHLAPYKCPRQYIFIEQLPRTTNGKVQRKKLAHLV